MYTSKHALKALKFLGLDINNFNFNINDLVNGMNIEREHIYNKKSLINIKGIRYILACKIALAHLLEKPNYYKLLKKYIE